MKTSREVHAAALLAIWLALPACSSDDPQNSGPMGPSMGIVEVDPNRIQLGEGGRISSGGGSSPSGAPSTGATSGTGGGSGGSTSTALEKFGKPCETSADCPSGLSCRMDPDYVSHKQCTASCSDSPECAAVEAGAFCIGAHVCVHACKTQADCGPQTRCGSAGWCERTGPGSGVPYCGGVATPCVLLTDSTCISSSGCHDDSRCSGSAESCYSQFDSFSCNDVEGCYWSSNSCSGSPRSCSSFSGRYTCEDQPGCHWSSDCSGSARSCDQILTALCSTQPGCSLVTD
jgi:hypothetical protein